VFAVLVVMIVMGVTLRVRDEERVLKERFGSEWEEWRKGRKRSLPGVF
jgi:protein-S-isoprenylcysteine O-methyltransferase Ste14